MSIGQSKDAVLANVAQQGSALLLLLAVPNLLPVEHFAEVVFVGVLLSFTRFSDLGLTLVYGRDMPRHHSLNEVADIALWNRTVFWFGVLGGTIAGGVAALVMYMRFGAFLDAAIVALLPPLTAVVSAYVAMASVRSDFRAYRNSQVRLSLTRLLTIPFVFLFGLPGWLTAQAASLVLVVSSLGGRWIPRLARPDWQAIRKHLPAGLQLALITLLWTQLMDSARLVAAVYYPAEGIAIYGILVAAYQSVCTLAISAYLPVTVKTMALLGTSDQDASTYVFNVIHRTIPAVFVMAVIAAEIAPWVLDLLFPKYRIDPVMPRTILYGLTALPFVATLGNLYIGKRRTILYLGILALALAGTVGLEQLLRPGMGIKAAAVAQACGTTLLAVSLLVGSRFILTDVSGQMQRKVLSILGRLGALWAAYLVIKTILS